MFGMHKMIVHLLFAKLLMKIPTVTLKKKCYITYGSYMKLTFCNSIGLNILFDFKDNLLCRSQHFIVIGWGLQHH